MSIMLKLFLPALALAGSAAAQCSTATATIQNSGDASALATCTTFSGDIAIATQASGTIALNGISRLNGNLLVDGAANLTSLSADSLTSISKQFLLNRDYLLSTLNFPQLSQVGSISWSALPALQQLSFTTGVQKASEVLITNTFLTSLDGINLQVVDRFDINNNQYLKSVNVQLGNITQSLNIEANGKGLTAQFPNLQWAYNMTFRNVSDVMVPSLASVNGSMGFIGNYFTSFAAPNLTLVGGSLSFSDNTMLNNISLPQLQTINGAFQISKNPELQKIDGTPKVKVVGGALDFSGNFTDVSLPALNDVRGGFNMQSSGDITNACSAFKKNQDNSVIKGTYVCSGKQAKPGTAGTTPTSSGGGSSPTGAAGHFAVNVPIVMGLSSILAGLFSFSY
ncbi:MAG: hypothetical protein M1835_002742 [Candelina submexicana]|nr:MAG: hypothetical protein M1835_002742 [Candelina submexicana]